MCDLIRQTEIMMIHLNENRSTSELERSVSELEAEKSRLDQRLIQSEMQAELSARDIRREELATEEARLQTQACTKSLEALKSKMRLHRESHNRQLYEAELAHHVGTWGDAHRRCGKNWEWLAKVWRRRVERWKS